MADIKGFFGEYRWLSNFAEVAVEYDGEIYCTTEHAYQAAKTLDLEERKAIQNELRPAWAKTRGRAVNIRPDWEQIKLLVMHDLLMQKYHQQPYKKLLLDTEGLLEETNGWGDIYWGVCGGIGNNHLGQLTMIVRDYLRDNE